MTPRYPTNLRHHRRHQKRSPLPVIVLGLVAGGGGYLLFGGGKHDVRQVVAPAQTVAEKKPLEVVEGTGKRPVPPPPAPKDKKIQDVAAAKEPAKEKDKKAPEPTNVKEKKHQDAAELALAQEEKSRQLTLKVSDAIVLPSKGIAPPGKKPPTKGQEPQAPSPPAAKGSNGPGPSTAAPAKPANAQADEEVPPLPKGLTPKTRPHDVELTFYDALANRKVVLPVDPPPPPASHGAQAGKQSGQAAARSGQAGARPAAGNATAQADKKAKEAVKPADSKARAESKARADTGSYMVQFGVFSTQERASQVVAQLQSKGRAAHVVQSEGATGPMYRVRTGPYPTLADAKNAMGSVATDGQSPVIIKPPPP
ncbi:MAG: SPOR domain-containing protein [Magnetococcales bacterium]|nr:SPOR domain-containing protein [Magnetococcales bacterium]